MYMNLKTVCLALFACCLTGCAGQAGLLGFGVLSTQDRNDYRHARDLFNALKGEILVAPSKNK